MGGADQGQQPVAQLEPQVVDFEGRGYGFFGRRRRFDRVFDLPAVRFLLLRFPLGDVPRRPSRDAGEEQKRHHGYARQERQRAEQDGTQGQGPGLAAELPEQGLLRWAADARLGDHQTGGGGDDQGRDLRDQAVAHREARIGVGRLGEAKALLGDADDHAADDVDERDQQTGDGIAAHELCGAVHGAEEGAFVLQRPAPGARLVFVDQSGRQVGVDGHLLARHGVKGEAGGNLGDAARTLGDDDEVDDDQDAEDDDADDEVAAHDKAAEGLDDAPGGVGSFVAVGENQPRGGHVEGQADHGGEQKDRREGVEIKGRLDEEGGHQNEHGKGDGNRQAQVQQPRGQGHDQDHQNRNDAQRQRDIAAASHRQQVFAQLGARSLYRCRCGGSLGHGRLMPSLSVSSG